MLRCPVEFLTGGNNDMRHVFIIAALLAGGTAAIPAAAQSGASIPSQFHGRWAPNAAACRDAGPSTQVVTINARGWSSFEEGARVLRRGQVRNTTHYFATEVFAGADEHSGSLALRRSGAALAFSETVQGQTTHKSLVRCR